jgi:hypothetical protein
MGMLAWVMMGLALWHFTIFLPDRFWAGIVGALLGSIAGGMITGFVVPGRDDTELITALESIPGALAGMALVYYWGVRNGNEALHL